MRSSRGRTGLVVLTGAGISQESGLATFRSEDGLWMNERVEDVATPEGFRRDPAKVHAFYNQRRAELAGVAPNAAHQALATLEREWVKRGAGFLLVTQNVDDLHERGGSHRLLHMHGSLLEARCGICGAVFACTGPTGVDSVCAGCGRAGWVRPNIVWFGEMPIGMERIGAALDGCGLFVSIGTSGNVYPAAGFVAEVRGRARTVELNLEPSLGTRLFDEARHGPATEVVAAFVDEVLADLGA
jgi:NAD-dependent deacetylase